MMRPHPYRKLPRGCSQDPGSYDPAAPAPSGAESDPTLDGTGAGHRRRTKRRGQGGLADTAARTAENIVFIGPTGVGKTGLASGLLLKALQNGYRGVFMRAQDLFDEMYASVADRSTRRLLNRLAKVTVLVIDEMGYLNLRPEQTNIFFKLMEERYRQRPTIITTNLDYSEWANFLGNKSLVSALLSRLRHQCHTVKIDGPSLRDGDTTTAT